MIIPYDFRDVLQHSRHAHQIRERKSPRRISMLALVSLMTVLLILLLFIR